MPNLNRYGVWTTLQAAATGAANGATLDLTDALGAEVEISGTYTGLTANFEASPDSGTTWDAVQGIPLAGGAPATTATATGGYIVAGTGAYTLFRVRLTASSPTGSITVKAAARLVAGEDTGVVSQGAAGTSPWPVVQPSSTTGTAASVAASATVVTLQALNTARLGWAVYHDSTANLYLKLGSGASLTSFTIKIAGGGYWELPFRYTGIITGIWDTATGTARVTELT